jgi:hypothetical protein
MKTKLSILPLAVAVAATPAMAVSYGINLRGHVPTVCKVKADLAAVAIEGNLVDLGSMREFCNAPAGYDVFVDYGAELAGARLMVDGNAVELTDAGTASLASESTPARKDRALAIDLSNVDSANGALSFRIVAR